MAWLWTAAVAEVLLEQLIGGVRVQFQGFIDRLKGI